VRVFYYILLLWSVLSAGNSDFLLRTIRRTARVRTAPVWSQHVAPRSRLHSCRRRLLQLAPLLIRTPLMSSLLARASDWPRPRRRPRCCYCCRSAAVVCPYACRQNAAPLAETAGDCKSHWWTSLYTTWFSCRLACSIYFLVDGCSTRCEDERRHLTFLISTHKYPSTTTLLRCALTPLFDLLPRFQISRCSPLLYGLALSSLAMSSSAISASPEHRYWRRMFQLKKLNPSAGRSSLSLSHSLTVTVSKTANRQ